VLRQGQLAVYKDQKSARASPDVHFRSEAPVAVRGGSSQVAGDYTKKKFVFRLKLSNGGEYLFQAKDDDEMNAWVTKLQGFADAEAAAAASSAAAAAGGAAGSSRAQTLPASAAGGSTSKDEPKKRSFFTLKKK